MLRTPGKAGRPARTAFTLIEVLVVVAIIALLIAILLPALQTARGQSKRVVCMSNLHQIYAGLIMYKDANGDRIPDWITVGKWFFRRAPGLKDPSSPTSLQETFGINALLAGVRPVESGNVVTKKRYLSAYSEVWRCPAAPASMWDQWKNTYANLKFTVDPNGKLGYTTNSYTKLMMNIKRGGGATDSQPASKIAFMQDNYSWKPGNCGWMGAESWSTSSGYKLNQQPPHMFSGRRGTEAAVILWLDGNAGRTGGRTGI